MNPAAEILALPYRKQLLESIHGESRLLFLNAEHPPILAEAGVSSATLIQPRYDKALPFLLAGHVLETEAPPSGAFDTVWVLPAKDGTETQYLLALGFQALKAGGVLLAAAANDAGGKRLAGLFEELGLSAQAESKNKCRIVFAVKQATSPLAETWQRQGEDQPILDGAAVSRPGVYGWDKIDAGSAVLMRHAPPLAGHVADFGCGWGYLSLQAAAKPGQRIKRLTLIDVDSRALSAAALNIKDKYPEIPQTTLWTDLSRPISALGPYDAILLNPPFHDGTQAVPALGQAIIGAAAGALKEDGVLYLVANKHLPYEKTLRESFAVIEPLAEEDGFKAFACRSMRRR